MRPQQSRRRDEGFAFVRAVEGAHVPEIGARDGACEFSAAREVFVVVEGVVAALGEGPRVDAAVVAGGWGVCLAEGVG